MRVTVSETEVGKKILEVEVPVERTQNALQAAYTKYQKKTQLPGFRKGKVPLDIIRTRFGKAIESEVVEDLISETYKDAQKEQGINPAGAAQIENVEFAEGKPLKYKATVEVFPQIALKEYKGIEVTKEIPRITDKDVDAALESLREHYAEVITVDEEAKEGHYIVADIQGVDRSGVPIVGDKVENVDFQLGKSSFGPEFDKELLGLRRDDQRIINVTYPKDHSDPKLAGSEQFFSVKVREIKEKRLPEIDDDLAKTVSELDTLADLRKEVRADLLRRAELEIERKVRDQIAEQLTKENPIPVPEGLVTRFLDSFVADIKQKSQEPFDEELLRNRYRSYALNQIRLHLILEEIGRLEHIGEGDEKVLDYLVEQAQINEIEPVRKEDYPSLVIEP